MHHVHGLVQVQAPVSSWAQQVGPQDQDLILLVSLEAAVDLEAHQCLDLGRSGKGLLPLHLLHPKNQQPHAPLGRHHATQHPQGQHKGCLHPPRPQGQSQSCGRCSPTLTPHCWDQQGEIHHLVLLHHPLAHHQDQAPADLPFGLPLPKHHSAVFFFSWQLQSNE